MSDEAAFLNAILANPEDNAPRLVYADWLEEQGDLAADAKAAYLRDTAALLTATNRRAKRLHRRLFESAAGLPSDWLAVVSRIVLEGCSVVLEFEVMCPQRWEKLSPTDDTRVRHCDHCKRPVYYCTSIREAQAHAQRGECVAVELSLPRRPNDLDARIRTLGRIRPSRPAE